MRDIYHKTNAAKKEIVHIQNKLRHSKLSQLEKEVFKKKLASLQRKNEKLFTKGISLFIGGPPD